MNKKIDRKKGEEEFHDNWAKSINVSAVSVEKYFNSVTAIEGQYALERLGKLRGKKILDLGCGFGESSVWFALQGANVLALDISEKMLGCVRSLGNKYKVGKKIKTIKASAEEIPIKSGSLDLIFGGNILHHADIVLVSEEIRRVLKDDGKAIFIEPLTYNPLINIYRKMANEVRTKTEKPFTLEDIRTLGEDFGKVTHSEFQLFTTLIFVWFFLGEGLHPSKVRYWKRFIDKGENYARPFKILNKIDNFILKFPFVRKYCWNTVIELVK